MKHFIIVFLLLLVSCNYETTINEYSEYSNYSTTTKSEVSYNERKVSIIVTNDAKGVVFETDSIVLYYQDIDTCKTFTTQKYYIDSIVLNGRILPNTTLSIVEIFIYLLYKKFLILLII